jgi:phosphoadenosine phosphosulfate reductase
MERTAQLTISGVRRRPEGLDDFDLADLNDRLETAAPVEVVRWAVETFGEGLCLSASMADAVLIDIATKVDPDIEVIFLDTQYHFPETLTTLERIWDRYNLNLRIMRPDVPVDDRWRTDVDGCCGVRRVDQLDKALEGKLAWMSGLRRTESASRADARILSLDRRGLVKVNPLATWSDLDVSGYIADHDVIVNPLDEQGYPSIGCWPCTRPVAEGEDSRAGRWADLEKLECGIHL